MKQTRLTNEGFRFPVVAILAVAAIVLGLAFAAWLDHGAALFLSLAETGLSWCL